ncbi:hypothetical protein [Neoroseomonas oryzicola]|uniref:Uncharacterized protein n=1 Tax=Neoroseomonas oryzicola TaxID=535904 RepID=A0A9X9WC43_9PROT|nr:hypothetical protein [Neoroseomonas oryzicola]MBR0657903.1 hypothetical protein [Neoroseomonas oryzicola]NKE18779.1 hypothetical protein [Neoroseomonas oryzicola]
MTSLIADPQVAVSLAREFYLIFCEQHRSSIDAPFAAAPSGWIAPLDPAGRQGQVDG